MLIILVASVNIISSLLMTVMHRRNDIALLLSLGTSPRQIKKIFLTLGLIIGLGGMAMGIGLGFGSIYLLQTYDIVSLPADVYGSSKLPVDLDTMDFIYTVFGAISITLISAWYPAHKASKTNLLQVLRNE
jgi:putative ABC transport system permease protein